MQEEQSLLGHYFQVNLTKCWLGYAGRVVFTYTRSAPDGVDSEVVNTGVNQLLFNLIDPLKGQTLIGKPCLRVIGVANKLHL